MAKIVILPRIASYAAAVSTCILFHPWALQISHLDYEVSSILRDARKMFAVLVKCDLNDYIDMLTEERMSDEMFPIDDKSNLPIQDKHHLEEIRKCQVSKSTESTSWSPPVM